MKLPTTQLAGRCSRGSAFPASALHNVPALEASVSSPAQWEQHPSVSRPEDEANPGMAPVCQAPPEHSLPRALLGQAQTPRSQPSWTQQPGGSLGRDWYGWNRVGSQMFQDVASPSNPNPPGSTVHPEPRREESPRPDSPLLPLHSQPPTSHQEGKGLI